MLSVLFAVVAADFDASIAVIIVLIQPDTLEVIARDQVVVVFECVHKLQCYS